MHNGIVSLINDNVVNLSEAQQALHDVKGFAATNGLDLKIVQVSDLNARLNPSDV